MKKTLLLVLGLLIGANSFAASFDYSKPLPFTRAPLAKQALHKVSLLAIQSGGRVKPFDTFAREGMALLTGKEKFQGKHPVELTLSLVFEPQLWNEIPFLQITQEPLKRDLGLDVKQNFFSPKELGHSPRLMPLFGELQAKLKAEEKLDPYFQAVQRLGNQMSFLNDLIAGKILRFVPPTAEEYQKSDAWKSVDELSQDMQLRFTLVAATYVSNDAKVRERFPDHVGNFQELAKGKNLSLYPAMSALEREVSFNHLHPFRWSWILALLAIFVLVGALATPNMAVYLAGMGLFLSSFLLQTYGFIQRCMIAGRPPVSNMYESVLWVGFGCMLFGLIFEIIYRKRIIAIGSLIFCTIALIIADNISGVLDAGIHPLEPVLRSNLWLTVHVLTITLGYAAFALSLILGNIGLSQIVLWGRESQQLPLKTVALYAYRAVQVGVVLLAAGTILGGVWADYSWGRFWGWDPKETWALIALLGYLALLHARFRGMVKHFGFLAGCVFFFLGVLMAWYGVNFVLGVGKHSYGFSSGGVGTMAAYTSVQLLYVFYAMFLYKRGQA